MKPGLILGLSVLLGATSVVVAVMFASGGHGTYLPAKLLFPFTMLLTLFGGPIGVGGIAAAVLQFPLYGAAVAAGAGTGQARRVAAVVAGVHAVVVALALVLVP